MKCPLCGTENKTSASRCMGCGSLLSDDQTHTTLPAREDRQVVETPVSREPGAAEGKAGAGKRKTRVVKTPGAPGEAPAPVPHSPPRKPLRSRPIPIGPEPPPRTAVLPRQREARASRALGASSARLVGFLVSRTRDPAGTWAEVREGRLVVGSGSTADMRINGDPALSETHFSVHARIGKVIVKDLLSTNATEVDGREIWADHTPAVHGSRIVAGDTTFVLVLVPEETEER